MKHLLIIVSVLLFGNTVMAQDLELRPQTTSAHHDSVNERMARDIANTMTGPRDTTSNTVIYICCGGPKQPPPMYIVKVHQKAFVLDTLANVEPSTIEGIEVLKDEASYKKYGEAAKYGVIIIILKDEKYSENLDEFKSHIKRIES